MSRAPLRALALLGVLATGALAVRPPPAAQALFVCPPSPLPGGVSCRAPDAGARAAAAFAVSALNTKLAATPSPYLPAGPLTLSAIQQYGSQVVAGTNHYLQLLVTGANNAPARVQAVVYEKLPAYGGGYELSKYVVLPPGPGPVGGMGGPASATAATKAATKPPPAKPAAAAGPMAMTPLTTATPKPAAGPVASTSAGVAPPSKP